MKTLSNTSIEERGILTSSYKQEIRNNVRSIRSKSLSGFKSNIKKYNAATCCSLATSLQVSLFFVVLVLISF
ncbi:MULTISPECIES: hypothetical protein [Tenacibaculum]|uniref:hypothetical protein n=1 Tax=Tenacibaculum TaxID=104267 RepID=UPI001F0AC623|nr:MULTISPECIES: hypothetical protein [Tenacibaculum]MCH3881148.1 hypothetical protein [Tenacibaculum aquimarinum]MCH3883988.1 hypothetical protein [Tenacibaculum aquimarinum]MDO6599252.1 hypothetical protein [Tenacibaculum sp. 1_MG-2023]